MARKITFKPGHDKLTIKGQEITPSNLTPELYDYLVGVAPSHADLFDVVDDAASVTEEKKSTKPKPSEA